MMLAGTRKVNSYGNVFTTTRKQTHDFVHNSTLKPKTVPRPKKSFYKSALKLQNAPKSTPKTRKLAPSSFYMDEFEKREMARSDFQQKVVGMID